MEAAGAAAQWWSLGHAVSGALLVYAGRELFFVITPKSKSNSVIQDHFDILDEFN